MPSYPTLPPKDTVGTIYLLHFSQPYGHARHYTGWAQKGGLFRRLAQHESGNGAASPLIRALLREGGEFVLARTWVGDRHRERQIKKQGGAARHCPICKEEEEER
jgi:hypothetical protein